MKSLVSQYLKIADSLIEKREFPAALAELKKVNRNILSLEEKAYFCLLWSWVNLQIGNSAIEVEIKQALDFYKESKDKEKYARANFQQGMWLAYLGKFSEVREAYLKSLSIYKQCGDDTGQARVFNALSLLSAQLDCLGDAIENQLNSLYLLRKIGDDRNVTLASVNLAGLYVSAGKLSKASSAYHGDKYK